MSRSAPAKGQTLADGDPVDPRDARDARTVGPSTEGEAHAGQQLVSRDVLGDIRDLPTVDAEHYTISRELARGGLGLVLEAHDRTLDRTVAIKCGLRTDDAANARFIREALVTARLQHPSIVPVYEAGRWPGGEPFYTMKLVSGRPLSSVIADTTTLEQRLALLPNIIAVADAMAFAHRERIIHRDLKPSNVLIGEFGETVVIDWGLAKDLNVDDDPRPTMPVTPYDVVSQGLTMTGAIMGTPEYMAPEQARGNAVDERTDVYAIGGLLYHVLVGRAPFGGSTKEAILKQVVAGKPLPIEQRIPHDLATIVHKAMELVPGDRYPTAKELADDLKRFQTGQLISARGYTAWQLLGRWARRHRSILAISTMALVALGIVAAVAVHNVVDERNLATQARSSAEQARASAESRNNQLVLVQARSKLDRDPTAALAWLKSYPITAPDWREAHEIAIDAQERGVALHVLVHPNARQAEFTPDGSMLVTAGKDKQILCWDTKAGKLVGSIATTDDVSKFSISPDGKVVAFATATGGISIASLPWGNAQHVVDVAGDVHRLVFSHDNKYIAASGNSKVVLYERASHRARDLVGHDGPVGAIAFSPDSSLLATGGDDHTVRVWNVASGTSSVFADHTDIVGSVAFSADGARLASSSEDKTVRVRSLHPHKSKVEVMRSSFRVVATELATSGDVAFALENKSIVVRNLASGELVRSFEHAGAVLRWSFSRDRQHVIAGGPGGAMLVDLRSGESRFLPGQPASYSVALSPDGTYASVVGNDSSIRVWKRSRHSSRVLRGHVGTVRDVAMSPDNRLLASAALDRTIRVWNLEDHTSRVLGGHDNSLHSVTFSDDGKWIAGTAWGRTVTVWPALGDTKRVLVQPLDLVPGLGARFTPDNRIVTATTDGNIRLWNVETGQARVLEGRFGPPRSIDVTSNETIVTGDLDGRVVLWNLTTGSQRLLGSHPGSVEGVAFLPDRRHVLSRSGLNATTNHRALVWDVVTATSQILLETPGPIRTHAISVDGKWVAIAATDHEITLVELATGRSRSLGGYSDATHIGSLQFSPDGTMLAAGAMDGTVRLWMIDSGASQIAFRHAGPVSRVVFSSDGRLLTSASDDETAWSGAVVPENFFGADPDTLLRTIAKLTTATIDHRDRATTPF